MSNICSGKMQQDINGAIEVLKDISNSATESHRGV